MFKKQQKVYRSGGREVALKDITEIYHKSKLYQCGNFAQTFKSQNKDRDLIYSRSVGNSVTKKYSQFSSNTLHPPTTAWPLSHGAPLQPGSVRSEG